VRGDAECLTQAALGRVRLASPEEQLAAEQALREAVLEAGAARFRPIAVTAAAVVVGGVVMVRDPIFQGLAVALISGAVVATLLTMVVVPLLYWELRRRQRPSGRAWLSTRPPPVRGRFPIPRSRAAASPVAASGGS
jgi:uncharacterized membrane protein YdfJ with MMPL/SSD domain